MNNVKRILVLSVLCGVVAGLMSSDAGVPSAGAGSGGAGRFVGAVDAGVVTVPRYVEVVDAEGLSRVNVDGIRRIVAKYEDNSGYSLLHFAVEMNDVHAIRVLVYLGVDINFLDSNFGQTPLHNAVSFKSKNAMIWLLLLGADHTIKARGGYIPREVSDDSAREFFDKTYKEYCEMSDEKIACELLFSKSMRDKADEKLLTTLLDSRSGLRVAMALICGASCEAIDDCRRTVLHRAVMPLSVVPFGVVKTQLPPSQEILELLILHGVALFALETSGRTAEDVARDNGFVKAADFLAKKSAPYDARWSECRKVWLGSAVRAGKARAGTSDGLSA